MCRAWERGGKGRKMSSKWNLGKGRMEGGWQQVEGERLRTPLIWFESRKEKCLDLNYAAFLTGTGDWCVIPLMLGHHISACVWYGSCFSLSLLSASLSSHWITNSVIELASCVDQQPLHKQGFCWNSSKLPPQRKQHTQNWCHKNHTLKANCMHNCPPPLKKKEKRKRKADQLCKT